MRAMHFWRLSPRTWAQESVDARARMVAYMMFTHTREAYREQWKQDQREKRGNRDETNFAAMRHRNRTE